MDALPALDPLIHQPVRTQILAFLSVRRGVSFSNLKRVLSVTDGNLGAHLAKLVNAGLVTSSREKTGDSREQTVFSLTLVGRVALTTYVAHLSELVRLSSGNDQRTGATVSAKRE